MQVAVSDSSSCSKIEILTRRIVRTFAKRGRFPQVSSLHYNTQRSEVSPLRDLSADGRFTAVPLMTRPGRSVWCQTPRNTQQERTVFFKSYLLDKSVYLTCVFSQYIHNILYVYTVYIYINVCCRVRSAAEQ